MPVGEWFHCYSRGVDKRIVFESESDYERFLVHMYIANDTSNTRVSDLHRSDLHTVLANQDLDQENPVVEIGAYALMPTHIHLLLRQIREGGIATFMQRIFTGYTMYFNNRRERTGALFSGSFKSKHIADDTYLKLAAPYVLLNPIELFESRWKEGFGDIGIIESRLLQYPYSNLPDLFGIDRPQKKIAPSGALLKYYDRFPTLREMLINAQEYYRETIPQV